MIKTRLPSGFLHETPPSRVLSRSNGMLSFAERHPIDGRTIFDHVAHSTNIFKGTQGTMRTYISTPKPAGPWIDGT